MSFNIFLTKGRKVSDIRANFEKQAKKEEKPSFIRKSSKPDVKETTPNENKSKSPFVSPRSQFSPRKPEETTSKPDFMEIRKRFEQGNKNEEVRKLKQQVCFKCLHLHKSWRMNKRQNVKSKKNWMRH